MKTGLDSHTSHAFYLTPALRLTHFRTVYLKNFEILSYPGNDEEELSKNKLYFLYNMVFRTVVFKSELFKILFVKHILYSSGDFVLREVNAAHMKGISAHASLKMSTSCLKSRDLYKFVRKKLLPTGIQSDWGGDDVLPQQYGDCSHPI